MPGSSSQAIKKSTLYIGGGLLYWNGISRMTNASTITFMSLDAPISNWPTIEQTDQFARQLGLYAKGKAGLFDYRVAVARPFSRHLTIPTDHRHAGPDGTIGNYNPDRQHLGILGLLPVSVPATSSRNVLPYTVGTYIGAKKVFNFGFGFHAQPKAIALPRSAPETCRERACSSPRRTSSSTSRSRRKTAERPPGTASTTARTSDRTTSETSAS